MKFKNISILMLTIIGISSLQARHRTLGCAECADTETRTTRVSNGSDRLYTAIKNADVDEVKRLLEEDTHLKRSLNKNDLLEKVDYEIQENRRSSLPKGEKSKITRRLNKIKALLQGNDVSSGYSNISENVDTAYNNNNNYYNKNNKKYTTTRMPRTGYNSGFSNYYPGNYDADYSSGY